LVLPTATLSATIIRIPRSRSGHVDADHP
jgi:hypothetical protein